MKHIRAGLVVGGIFTAIGMGVIIIWGIASIYLGAVPAAIFIGLSLTVTMAAIVIDYMTERKES